MLLWGCSPLEATLSPAAVPDTGSNRIEISLGPGQDLRTYTTASIGELELLIRHQTSGSFVELPALSEGVYPLALDGQSTGATLTVYPAELIVEFVDVGQGDAVIIRAPSGEAYLVDTGPSGSAEVLRQRLRHHQIERLEQVILTHTDADHIGGLAELLEGPDGLIGSADDVIVGALVEDGSLSERTTQTARTLHALTIDRLPRRVAQAGDAITLPGGFRLTTVSAGGATVTQPASQEAQAHANARSVTLTVCLDGWCGWLGGDLTGGGLNTPDVERLVTRELGAMAFVKVPHHGSRSSSSAGLVETLSPRLAVMSLGTNNDHCHPTPEVVQRWSRTATVLSTGSGQVSPGRCDETSWPATSRAGCGSMTLSKGSRPTATISCGAELITF